MRIFIIDKFVLLFHVMWVLWLFFLFVTLLLQLFLG